jgi:adenylosuccinate synthase
MANLCTTKEVREILEESEIRMKLEMTLMEERLNETMKDTASNVLTPATITALGGVKDEFTKEVTNLKDFLKENTLSSEDLITIRSLLEGFKGVSLVSKLVGGLSKFLLSAGIIAGALFAFVKLGLK